MARKEITQEVVADIIGRYQRGQNATFIAFAIDIGPARVTAVLKANGVKMKGNETYRAIHNGMYPRRYHRKGQAD